MIFIVILQRPNNTMIKNLFILLFLFSNSLFSQVSSAPATSSCPIVRLYTQTVEWGGDGLWHEYRAEEPSDGFWINYMDPYKIQIQGDCKVKVEVRNTQNITIYSQWHDLEQGVPVTIFQDNFIAMGGEYGTERIRITILDNRGVPLDQYKLNPMPGGE